jgi:hypothetical protein
VKVDAIVLRLRLRGSYEAADLGVRLCQHAARDVYACHAALFIPIAVIAAIATLQISAWIGFGVWLLKPWFDRSILFVLARATFGERTTLRTWWNARHDLLFGQFGRMALLRLSLSRSFRLPVVQLEGLNDGAALRARMRVITAGRLGASRGLTSAFSAIELSASLALLTLLLLLLPTDPTPVSWWQLFVAEEPNWLNITWQCSASIAIFAIEPFYVAAGFGLYLNRRVDLEAWDVEQEFRGAFAR